MLSIEYIRKNKEKVKKAARDKGREVDIDKILKFDDKRRDLIQQVQKIREERNKLAKEKPTDKIREKGKKLKEELKAKEKNLKEVEEKLNNLLSYVPNVPLTEVPVGEDERYNREIRRFGTPPKFDFKPKSHLELGRELDLIDFERGVKVSGFRGYFLKNEAARLQQAILYYVFEKLVKKGFIPIIAPAVVKGFTLFGSGQFPWGEADVYKLNDDDAYLAGTAEIPVTAYYSDEILEEKELPKKFVAFSPCFRKEAGAYGKDTKGIYRLHEFWKVEQVILAENNLEKAKQYHEELQKNCEEILQELEIAYRVVIMSTGEMGDPKIKMYDTEGWMPSRGGYGELMSNSIMGDFQTRRLNIKYRKKNGSLKYCFSLNNTAVASPRILIALLENQQQKDGSILIPKVLKPLMGFDRIVKK